MKIGEAIDLVRFYIDEDHDSNITVVNDIWTDARITYFLYEGMKEYAKITKGLEGIETFATVANQHEYRTSGTAIKDQGYKRVVFLQGDNAYPVSFVSRIRLNDYLAYGNRTESASYPNLINYWNDRCTIYPSAPSADTYTLAQKLVSTDTEIILEDATLARWGRIKIDDEKIDYNGYYTTTLNGATVKVLSMYERAMEDTTEAVHEKGATATFQNMVMEIQKLPYTIATNTDGTVPNAVKNKEMEIDEEDQNIAIEYAAWKCLEKETDNRFQLHKENYQSMIMKAKLRIIRQRQGQKPFDMVDYNTSTTMSPWFRNWR